MNRRFSLCLLMFLLAVLSGCGYNTLQTTDEQITAGWAEVLNQYQRRADLVPNLVNVVKGYAAHEVEVLTRVTDARATVGAIQQGPDGHSSTHNLPQSRQVRQNVQPFLGAPQGHAETRNHFIENEKSPQPLGFGP